MCKFSTNTNSEDPPLIFVSILAIISITMHLSFPQYALVVKADNNIKSNIMQENSSNLEKLISVNQRKEIEAKLAEEERDEEKERKEKKISKIPATPIKNKIIDKHLERNNRTKAKHKKLVMVTAYSSTVDQTDSTPFITASGVHVRDGIIAANFLKFGTKVKFPYLYGNKIFVVEDRMKSNYKVDIWFPTRAKAKKFGAKRLEMEIL